MIAVAAASLVGVLVASPSAAHSSAREPAADARVALHPAGLARCAAPLTASSLDVTRRSARAVLAAGAARLGSSRFPDGRFPETAPPGGRWSLRGVAAWTSGFEPASRWILAAARPSATSLAAARARSSMLAVASRSASHDVGFMAGWPAALAARTDPSAAGRARYRGIVAQAVRSLDTHWLPGVGGFWSWTDRPTATVIVDSLVSVRAVWEAQRLGVATPLQVAHARSHARLVARTHLRPDGSTFHVVELDPVSGQVVARRTAQGWTDGSTWARGQAWAILGFAEAWRATGDPVLLNAARRTAQYWVSRVPASCVPAVDFDAPAPVATDSSAAAVAAVGLHVLAASDPDVTRSRRWLRTSAATMQSLARPPWLARSGPALLAGGSVAWTRAPRQVATVYGDAYALEAASRWVGLILRTGRLVTGIDCAAAPRIMWAGAPGPAADPLLA